MLLTSGAGPEYPEIQHMFDVPIEVRRRRHGSGGMDLVHAVSVAEPVTLRFHFDRDFITKNRAYNYGVEMIDVKEHSWLNFFMKDDEKVTLFRKGALAAAKFLRDFNWEEYKAERLRNFEMREERFANPNNM